MMRFTHSVRRLVLVLVAFAGAAGWDSNARGADKILTFTTFGAEHQEGDDIMALFDVSTTDPPEAPNWIDAELPPAHLEFVYSWLVIQFPPFYGNLYSKTVSGFDVGKTYRAKFYRLVGEDYIYQSGRDVVWTQE